MNEQKEREAFEKWYAAEYLMPPGAFRQVEGTYEKGFVKDGWEAWEARAKLEPQWIDVRERLPDAWTPVLATYRPFNDPSYGMQVQQAQLTGIGDWVSVSDGGSPEIVYAPEFWMPLPSPPSPNEEPKA
jgi:hypothetical protein